MTGEKPLTEKLRILGIRKGVEIQPIPKKKTTSTSGIESLPGRFIETRAGETYLMESTFPGEYLHWNSSIQVCTPLPHLAAWLNEPHFMTLPLEAYAFLDTETSGLAGGTGTYAFLVGVARFQNGGLQLSQFFMRDPSEEAALLEGLADFMAPCAALVTFNGKAFDAPLLKTRYTMHGIPNPFKDFAHLDLLSLSRRLWRDRLPSRALKYLEEHVLMAPRTAEEVPGYEIPYLYFDFLRTGDAAPLKGVAYHNAMDIVALVALLGHIERIFRDPFNEKVEHGLDIVALARFYEDIGQWETAARLFEHGLEHDLPEEDFWQAIMRLSILQKKRGDLVSARELWEQAAENGHIYAHIELAKYFEHHCRQCETALSWTESAINLVKEQDIARYVFDHWMDELTHRRIRLKSKIKQSVQVPGSESLAGKARKKKRQR